MADTYTGSGDTLKRERWVDLLSRLDPLHSKGLIMSGVIMHAHEHAHVHASP